jgi:hypothetical protein
MLAFTCLVFLDLKKGCIEWVLLVVDTFQEGNSTFLQRGGREVEDQLKIEFSSPSSTNCAKHQQASLIWLTI